MRRESLIRLVVAVATVVAGACSSSTPVDSMASATTTTAAPATTAGDPGPGNTILRSDGLGTLAFGTPTAAAMERLTAHLGPVRQGVGPAANCAGVVKADWRYLVAWFADDRFAGWAVDWAGGSATPEGIKIGSRVQDLRDTFGSRLTWRDQTRQGHEFAVDARTYGPYLGGAADGTENDSRVQHLWAGTTCPAP